MTGPPDLAPTCGRCRHRHLTSLPCWGGRWVQQLRRLVLETYGDTCWICGHPGADTADHLTPRSRAGTDALANLRPAHLFCNTGRGAATYQTGVTVATSDRW